MTDMGKNRDEVAASQKWESLTELDRALAENRFTEYRIKKAWADPLERRLTVAVVLLVIAVFAYLVLSSMTKT